MLKSRLIRLETAELHFEVMAFLIQNHGLPPRPQPPIFRHMSKGFETLAWTDQDSRSVFDWADDNFGTIVTACHMDTFDLCLVANDRALDEHKIIREIVQNPDIMRQHSCFNSANFARRDLSPKGPYLRSRSAWSR